jgi:hypothetical protein
MHFIPTAELWGIAIKSKNPKFFMTYLRDVGLMAAAYY